MTEDKPVTRHDANAAFEAGDFERAKLLFEQLRHTHGLHTWSLFNLGRIARAENDLPTAYTYYAQAQAENPGLFWTQFELLSVLLELNKPEEDIRKTAEQMISLVPPKGFAEPHFNQIERIAHLIFDKINNDLAVQVFEFLYRLPVDYRLSVLGLSRILEAGENKIEREEISQALGSMEKLSEDVRRKLAKHRGTPADSRQIDEVSPADQLPQDFAGYLAALKKAVAEDDKPRVKQLRQTSDQFPQQQQHFLELIAEIELNNAENAAEILYEHARLFRDLPKFPGIRVIYILLDAYQHRRANLLLSLLWIHYPEDTDIVQLTIVFLMRSARYAEAEKFYDRFLEPLPDKSDAIVHAKVELLEVRGEMDAALKLLQPLLEQGEPPRKVMYTAIRIAAERGRWDEVYSLGYRLLSNETSFPAVLDPMVRAARATGRVNELYDAIKQFDPPAQSGAGFVQQALFEDLVATGSPDLLEQIETIDFLPARKARLMARLRSTARPIIPNGRNQIYYCADDAYLEPALTSLTSLVVSNMALAQSSDLAISLIVEAKSRSQAEAGAAPLQEALGININIIDASTILPKEHGLRAEYGMSTGGHSLSVAAYYRIFFAKALAVQGDVDQALYIDADTLVGPGLSEVFSVEVSAPVFARPEVDRPEINHAAAAHELLQKYFNSGVLLFDFRNPDTSACLDKTIHAALSPEVHLFYQDQCALNIGFNGKAGELCSRFNYFITPDNLFTEAEGEGVILHYLDRPKPWDSLYRQNAEHWFNWQRIRHNLAATAKTPIGVAA